MKYHLVLIVSLISAFSGGLPIIDADELPVPKPHPFGKREHVVEQLNGEYEPASLPAEIQWISEPWYRALDDENAQMPYLAYMAEKDRVVMLVVPAAAIRSRAQASTYSGESGGMSWDRGGVGMSASCQE